MCCLLSPALYSGLAGWLVLAGRKGARGAKAADVIEIKDDDEDDDVVVEEVKPAKGKRGKAAAAPAPAPVDPQEKALQAQLKEFWALRDALDKSCETWVRERRCDWRSTCISITACGCVWL